MDRLTSASSDSPGSVYVFGAFRLEADGRLLRKEEPVDLSPRELAALRFLLARAGQVVTHSQLRQAVWSDMQITADAISKCMSSLRARLGPEECIQTVYKRGYRFFAPVRPLLAGLPATLPRLAIVPFTAEFDLPEFLGSAVAEETAACLSEAHPAIALALPQESVSTLARRGLSAQQIGRALEADLVLTGTLRFLPAHYRLRVKMIRTRDGAQLWLEDLFAEQSRVAGLVRELVQILAFHLLASNLSISAVAASADSQESDPQRLQAYQILQRAHFEWQSCQRHSMQDSLQRLLRAIELDPSMIAARLDLANLCLAQTLYGFLSPSVAAHIVRRSLEMGAAADAVRRWDRESISELAVRCEAILPALGWIKFHVDRDLPAALLAFSLSSHLLHNPWITRARVMFELSRHRFGQAIETLREAIHLDPYSPWLQACLGWALHLAGESAASMQQIEHALAHFPEHEASSLLGAIIVAHNGDAARGIQLAQELAQRRPYLDLASAVQAYALACAGHADEARAILLRLDWLGRERFVLNTFAVAAYVVLGERDSALAELRKSDEVRCPWFFQMLADPRLQPLRTDPEFIKLRGILPAMEAAAARNTQQQ